MPILFTDTHICENCGKPFEWNYFEMERHPISQKPFPSEAIPSGKLLVHKFALMGDQKYSVAVNCPRCGFDNFFEYDNQKNNNCIVVHTTRPARDAIPASALSCPQREGMSVQAPESAISDLDHITYWVLSNKKESHTVRFPAACVWF